MRLPPGWSETLDDRGRKYYYNSQTGESSWEPPAGTQMDPVPIPKPPGPPGPPPMRQGPPALNVSGAPPMMNIPPSPANRGPPPMGGSFPPPSPANRAGPPTLPGMPPPSPANRTGPPPMGGAVPPSPANRTGPPGMPPMSESGSLSRPPSIPGQGPPSIPSQGPPSIPSQGPPSLASPGGPRLGGPPPPPMGGKPPGQLPPHLQGAPFAATPVSPPSSVSSYTPQSTPGQPPVALSVGTMSANLPPPRAPGMTMSGGPPPPPGGRQPSATPPMQVGAMLPPGPPQVRLPGMSVSGGPPPHAALSPSSSIPPTRAPGMSVSGPPGPPGPPTRAPGMSIGGGPPPPPMRGAGLSVSGPPPGFPVMTPQSTAPPSMASTLPLTPEYSITPQGSHAPPAPQAPRAPQSPQSPQSIPYPWKEATSSANGKTYYYNTVTNQTSWVHPGLIDQSAAAPIPTTSSSGKITAKFQSGERRFAQTFTGSVTMRSGMFKSWEPRYLVVKDGSLFSVYDNESMKKERVKGNITSFLIVPINRGEGKNVIVIYDFAKQKPNETSDVNRAKYTHYFDCGSNEVREQILDVLYDQGAIIRRPIFEAQTLVNKEPRFVTAFNHCIQFFKKATDDEPDTILTFLGGTFFQDTPSQFPLLYEDGKLYGPVTPHTFVIADHCNEDATLYYISIQSSTNPNTATNNTDEDHLLFIKELKSAVSAAQTKVDPTSLLEGYLYKASTNLQRWARRYFILRRDSLTYYRNRGDEKSAGECNLPNGFEINLHPDSITYPFPLFVAESGDEGTRQYLMCALNDPDYETWCNTLSTLQQQKQVKKDQTSLKEGYINLCGKKQAPHRKYVVVRQECIRVFHSRLDDNPALEIPLPKGCYISEAQLPGDDTLGTQRLSILSVINPQTNDEHFFGTTQPKEREEWIVVLKSIAGDAVAKSHPQSYHEGYVYKSKKKGALGSLKYCVITPQILFYTDKKESDVLSTDPQVQKRVKKFQQTGDAPFEEDLTSIPGYKGLIIPSTGDESGGELVYLYYSDDAEYERAKTAYVQAVASVDWRRNENSIFEGYIWKSNASGKSWTWRYTIITSDAVSFYKGKFDNKLAGQMPLAGCTFTTTPMSDMNNPTTSKDDRVALDYFASQFKSAANTSPGIKAAAAHITQDQLRVIAIRPSSANPKAKPIWIAQFIPQETSQWFQIFNELSSVGKQMHPGSIKEGYLCFGDIESQNRKYISLYADRIQFHPSRIDTSVESTLPLCVGFDVLYKDNAIYVAKSNEATEHVSNSPSYARFSNAVGGEVLGSWLQAFLDAYQARTPSPAGVRIDTYANVSYNKGQQEFKFIILTGDKICIFPSRSHAFPNPADTQLAFSNATHTLNFVQSQLQVSQLGPQRIHIQIAEEQLVLDFRADYESQSFYTELTQPASTAPKPASNLPGLTIPSSPAGPNNRFSMAAAIVSPSARMKPLSFPPPGIDDDEAPPPPVFMEEEEDDAPPPPPPDFDDEPFAPPAPAFAFAPPTPEPQAPAPAQPPRAMPLYDSDDDDDLPDFIKEKRRQNAMAAAAPAAPAAPVSMPPPAAPSSSFKAPISSSASSSNNNGLGLDFDFTFDLPPAPVFDLPPPGFEDDTPSSPPAATLASSSSVRKPLFGANRGAAAAAVATPVEPVMDSKYQPIDFDDDDDDLPPPGGK